MVLDESNLDKIKLIIIEKVPLDWKTTYVQSLRIFLDRKEFYFIIDEYGTRTEIRLSLISNEEELFQKSTVQDYGDLTITDMNNLYLLIQYIELALEHIK